MATKAELSVIAVGDIAVNGRYRRLLEKEEPGAPLQAILPSWTEADLRLGNLESPICTSARAAPAKMTLRGAPGAIELLRKGGFNCLTLANNHMMDYGAAGIRETHAALESGGIRHGGSGLSEEEARAAVLLERAGQRIGILSYCDVEQKSPLYATAASAGVAALNVDQCLREVSELRPLVDWVIVQLHWGLEMAQLPSPSQRQLARRFVQAGADLILGHHPHLLQPMEIIKGTPVLYSLGNFLFSEMYWQGRDQDGRAFTSKYRIHPDARLSAWLEARLRKDEPPQVLMHPVRLTKRLRSVPDESPERYAEWEHLCALLRMSTYEKEYAMEVERARARVSWQLDWKPIKRRIELKLYRWGLMPLAVEGD